MGNPLRQGLGIRRPADPATVVVFGATGDLARRKIMPALFNLSKHGHVPSRFLIVGYARGEKTDDVYRDEVQAALQESGIAAADTVEFLSHVHYCRGQLGEPQGYASLSSHLQALESAAGLPGNRLFYLAIAPEHFAAALGGLASSGLVSSPRPDAPFTRIVIEKPFGHDLASARDLNRTVLAALDESQVYRIDHYLGKETVQNILAFRFANPVFEPVWSARYVETVQVTVAETIGMPGRRAQYFDSTGILRDIVQNHALQLVCLVAMEPPASLDAEALRDEKVRLLRTIHPMTRAEVAEQTVRGQYGAGSIFGKAVPAYREENLVSPDSTTETYAALRFAVRNWRWAGVPFFVRAGKRLAKRATEIAITFRQPPYWIFGDNDRGSVRNTLVLRIQPDEGIALSFGAKRPGMTTEIQPVQMDFRYGTSFGTPSPEAYERLLLDALVGDASLFTRADEIELAWGIITPVLDAWAAQPPPAFPNYEAGTWGPSEADRLGAGFCCGWRRP